MINSGSSSLKYELVEPRSASRLAIGLIDRIGEGGSRMTHTDPGGVAHVAEADVRDHEAALGAMLDAFGSYGPPLDGVVAVGHRVVTAGDVYSRAVLIDDAVMAVIERFSPLAPLHNPANLVAIRVATERFAHVPHVAVFDTAYFADLPAAAATYAIDRDLATRFGIRRYGAHGTSHRYVAGRVVEHLGVAGSRRLIVLHLGNGASASAVLDGSPVDTSMGLTPLEGLVMGTRCGDLDPAIPTFLQTRGDMSPEDVDDALNRQAGMLGMSGHRDMRDVHDAVAGGDQAAREAIEVYVHRLRKYIGAYAAVLGGIDALAFTAGVGENDAEVRAAALVGLDFLGLQVDPSLNTSTETGLRAISPDDAEVAVLVVPTDEELAIAREVIELTGG